MRRVADRMLHLIARLAAFGWFRSVEVVGIHLIEHDHATLVVANHSGGFVDPALLTAVLPRVPRFLAMARLWKIWPIRPFLAFAGAIPVQRTQDGATGRNVDAFSAAHRVLADGGLVGIFPEGQASDEPHLLPVRTGAARIALGACAAGVRRIRIVPVGLIYERKQTARTRAYVRVGTPIDLDRWVGSVPADPDDHPSVERLTRAISEGLGEAAMDYDDAAQAHEFGYAAVVYLRKTGGNPSWAPPLSAIDRVAGALADTPVELQGRVRDAVTSYRAALEANDATDRQVAAGPRDAVRPSRVVGGLLTLVAVPFALLGLVANAVPAGLVFMAGRRPAAPVTLATVKFLVGLVTFPVTWLAWRYLAFSDSSTPWLLTLTIGPVCGLVAAVVGDRLRRARLARLRPSRLAVPGRAAEDLAERRAWLVDEVEEALGGRLGNLAGSLDD